MRRQIIGLIREWKGERLEDGQPKVQDHYLEKLRHVILEGIWLPLYVKGYQFQYEDGLKYPHERKKLVGRAATCTFIPTKPDLYPVVKEKGDQNGWEGICNQWVVDNLVEGDVVVAGVFDKVFNGTFAGGNLTTAINVRTRAGGAVIWSGIRDIKQMNRVDTQVCFRGIHLTPIRECVMTGYNMTCRIDKAVYLPGDVVMDTPSGVLFVPSFYMTEVIDNAEKTHTKDIFGFAILEQGIYATAEIDNSVWSAEMLGRIEAFIQADERCKTYRTLDWTLKREAAKDEPEALKEILGYCPAQGISCKKLVTNREKRPGNQLFNYWRRA